jgi:hypothetical protein
MMSSPAHSHVTQSAATGFNREGDPNTEVTVMSNTTHTHLSRALATAGLLVAASLARPGGAGAQVVSPERSLLNRTTVAADFRPRFRAVGYPADDRIVGSDVSGEQALLGRTAPYVWITGFELDVVPTFIGRPPIDGPGALLGRRDWSAESR